MSTIIRFMRHTAAAAGLCCLTLALASCSDKRDQGKEAKEYIQDLKRQVKEKRQAEKQAEKQAQQEAFDQLQREVTAFNAKCPVAIDPVTTCSGCDIENGDLCYYYVVDEESVGVSVSEAMTEGAEGIKQNLINTLRGAQTSELLELCRQCGANFIYRYGGDTTGEVYDINISLDEI